MISILLDRNNLIKNLLTAKSNDFKSLFVSAKHSSLYISIGIYFDLINSTMTSSDAFLPIFTKDSVKRTKERFFGIIERTFELSTLYNVDAQIPNFIRPQKFMTITGNYTTDCVIVSRANTHAARFLPRDAMHKRGLCRRMRCLCICVCVCLSVTFVDCVKTNKHIFTFFHRRVATPF